MKGVAMKLWAILAVLVLAACAETHALKMPAGSYVAANPGKWTASPADLQPEDH